MNSNPNKELIIYLDIDGVLLNDSLDNRGKPANGATELIKFVVDNFPCYWLTTHCRGGENYAPLYLSGKFPDLIPHLNEIKPTEWSDWKTEAIDFSKDFRWIDDDVYEPEIVKLREHHCEDKLIQVNLRKDPDQLSKIIETLSKEIPRSYLPRISF